MYDIIISMKTGENYSEIQRLIELLENDFAAPSYNIEFTESEINLYGEILNNFSTENFNSFIELNNNLRLQINDITNNSKREIFLNDLSSYEWIKVAIEETIENDQFLILDDLIYQTMGNPVPGPRESSGNYIDRCMKSYINENFTWANLVKRVQTVLEGPVGLLWAFASCEYTYYFDNPHN